MPKRIILITLQTFSTTGGIQKMARTLSYSLNQIAKADHSKFEVWSLYDSAKALLTQYVPATNFKGFNRSRLWFVLNALASAKKIDCLVLSHINLALVGILVKFINPNCQLHLIAHGIEVWRPLSKAQRLLLDKCKSIICVSAFTQQQMVKRHHIAAEKLRILNNALDPFIQPPADFNKPGYLISRYHINAGDQVIFTLTRLASTEQYKGYEQVIMAMSDLKASHPKLKYILAGPYDKSEQKRIQQLIHRYEVQDRVLITGFIYDSELTDHFLLADLFVLPSRKEGFGLVFIEALACGLPVICGNADGSTDAIKHGELGKSVDADNVEELKQAIEHYLSSPLSFDKRRKLQEQCIGYFNEQQYRNQLSDILLYE